MPARDVRGKRRGGVSRGESFLVRWGPVLVALAAFLLRMAYLAGARQSPLFENLGLDARFYDRWARQIASGDWIGSRPFFMGPLYPYVLGVFYRVAGTDVLRVAVAQAVVDSLTSALVYLSARRIWKREWAGLIAGGLACLYGPMMLYVGEILLPTLGTFLNTLFLYLILRAEQSRRPGLVFLAGLVLGLSALGKATVLVFLPVVVLWWAFRKPRPVPREAVTWALILLAGVAALVAPVAVRNRVVGRDWVLITSNAGLNFYIGNHPASSGAYLRPVGLDVMEDPEGTGIAEAARGRPLKASEVSRYWFSEAGDFLRDHPAKAAALFLKKMVFFWGAFEIPQIENLGFQRQNSPLLRLPFPAFGWVVPLAVISLAWGAGRRRWAALPAGLVVVYSVTIAVFFVTGRYRMAVVPYLLALSGGGILWMIDAARARALRRGLLSAAALVVLVGLSHGNPYRVDPESGFAEFEYRLGLNAEKGEDLDRAAAHYRRALDLEPFHPAARLNLGVILSRTGSLEEGRAMLETLAGRQPHNAKAQFNLGVVLGDLGQFEAATDAYARAVVIDETYVEAWVGLGIERYRSGDLTAARDALSRAVSLGGAGGSAVWAGRARYLLGKIEFAGDLRGAREPAARMLREGDIRSVSGDPAGAHDWYVRASEENPLPEIYYEAGVAALEIGRTGDAIVALRNVIDLDADFPGAHFSLGVAYVQQEDYGSAVRAFEAEAGISPSLPEVHLNLGLLYENYARDPEAALRAYEDYVRLGGSPTPSVRQRMEALRSKLGHR